MTAFPKINGLITDPPRAGECKLRIRSNGDPQETFVFVVDDQGVERELRGVTAVDFRMEVGPELPETRVSVVAAEVEIDVPIATVEPDGRSG